VLANERGDLIVADQRALRTPPSGQQTDVYPGLIHRSDGQGQRDIRNGFLPGPAPQRLEEGLLEETPRRVLHPDIDDSHQASLPILMAGSRRANEPRLPLAPVSSAG
jgi:hypothetical protein